MTLKSLHTCLISLPFTSNHIRPGLSFLTIQTNYHPMTYATLLWGASQFTLFPRYSYSDQMKRMIWAARVTRKGYVRNTAIRLEGTNDSGELDIGERTALWLTCTDTVCVCVGGGGDWILLAQHQYKNIKNYSFMESVIILKKYFQASTQQTDRYFQYL